MRILQGELVKDNNGLNKVEIIRRSNYLKISKISGIEDIARIMTDYFCIDKYAEEHGYLVVVNIKMNPICFFEVSRGKYVSTELGVKEVISRCLLVGGTGVILVHNHPSGDPEPSLQDEMFTRKFNMASDYMDLDFVDHLIIGDGCFYSMIQKRRLISLEENKEQIL